MPKAKLSKTFRAKQFFGMLSLLMKVLAIWPVNQNSNKSMIFVNNGLWWFYLMNNFVLLFPTIHTYFITTEKISASYTMIELTGIVESVVMLINFKLQEDRLKILLLTMKNQFDSQNSPIDLDNVYVYLTAFIAIAVLYIVFLYTYANKPVTDYKGLITSTHYTFSLESNALKVLLYCNQLIVLLYTLVIFTTDGVAVLFIYMCAVRLKILDGKFENAKDYKELKRHICEHEEVLLLIRETNEVVKVTIVKTVMCFVYYSISIGIQIFNHNEIAVYMMHPFSLLMIVYIRLYIYAETAENMTSYNNKIQFTVYSTIWYEECPESTVAKFLIIHRCQKLPKIYVNGIMAALNRNYLGRIFCSTVTYFTTIRAILNK